MKDMNSHNCKREHDFALIISGVDELTQEVEDALFEAGCDDATFGIKYGLLYAEFSRESESLQKAIISAIHDIRKANVGAEVVRVDECNLVTQSEIARRIGRSRQLVAQYISGQRGPGGFPPPEFHLSQGSTLWAWCAVSYWLAQNNLVKPTESWDAAVVYAINKQLELLNNACATPELMSDIAKELNAI